MAKLYKTVRCEDVNITVTTFNGFWTEVSNFYFDEGLIKTVSVSNFDDRVIKREEPIFRVPLVGKMGIGLLCDVERHPNNVGLTTRKVKPPKGKYLAYVVEGTLKHGRIDKFSRVYYPAGTYNILLVQDEPQDWSGWF